MDWIFLAQLQSPCWTATSSSLSPRCHRSVILRIFLQVSEPFSRLLILSILACILFLDLLLLLQEFILFFIEILCYLCPVLIDSALLLPFLLFYKLLHILQCLIIISTLFIVLIIFLLNQLVKEGLLLFEICSQTVIVIGQVSLDCLQGTVSLGYGRHGLSSAYYVPVSNWAVEVFLYELSSCFYESCTYMKILHIMRDGFDQVVFRLGGKMAGHVLRSLEEGLGFFEIFQIG